MRHFTFREFVRTLTVRRDVPSEVTHVTTYFKPCDSSLYSTNMTIFSLRLKVNAKIGSSDQCGGNRAAAE
jgi:hypothetical protein